MARLKRSDATAQSEKSAAGDEVLPHGQANESMENRLSSRPTPQVQRFASCVIVFHLGILLLGLSSNLSPSYLQSTFLDWTSIYSVSSGQDYGAIPLEWTHGETMGYPLVVQISRSADASSWATLPPPGVAITDVRPVDWTQSRYAHLSRAVRLLFSDTEDDEILGEFVTAFLRAAPVRDVDGIQKVRLVAPSVVNYQQHQDLLAAGDLTLLEAFPDQVVYTASVVKSESMQFTLVPDMDTSRTSKSEFVSGGTLP